ncbi:MAG: ABC transporter ATPase [Salibacteraceae bacterium]
MMNILSPLPDHSRVWIYTANRELTANEVNLMNQKGSAFVQSWKVHGTPLQAGFEIVYNRFIIIAVNENVAGASGCSIDSSVGLMKQFESEFNIVLLDKMNLGYHGDNNSVEVLSMMEFQNKLDQGGIHSETIVFNNLVETLGEVRTLWEVPLKNSWHKQLL